MAAEKGSEERLWAGAQALKVGRSEGARGDFRFLWAKGKRNVNTGPVEWPSGNWAPGACCTRRESGERRRVGPRLEEKAASEVGAASPRGCGHAGPLRLVSGRPSQRRRGGVRGLDLPVAEGGAGRAPSAAAGAGLGARRARGQLRRAPRVFIPVGNEGESLMLASVSRGHLRVNRFLNSSPPNTSLDRPGSARRPEPALPAGSRLGVAPRPGGEPSLARPAGCSPRGPPGSLPSKRI